MLAALQALEYARRASFAFSSTEMLLSMLK
nr:MAG TPA: hypothetical protein [Caudoviricetes sp.]